MPAELACIEERCRARFPITEILYNCPRCGGLLDAVYGKPAQSADELKTLWRARRTSNAPLDQSGVWRYREFIPFLSDLSRVGTPREGSTPRLARTHANPSSRGRKPSSLGTDLPVPRRAFCAAWCPLGTGLSPGFARVSPPLVGQRGKLRAAQRAPRQPALQAG